MQDSQKIKINPDFQLEEFEGEILLYSVSDTTAVYLNETAHLIWLLCHENMTVEEMVQFLQEKYPEQKDEVREDLMISLQALVAQGVVSLQHG